MKFFLKVSQQEQHRRFLSRVHDPEKNWKFSSGDLKESQLWNKHVMPASVSQQVLDNLKLPPLRPELSKDDHAPPPIYQQQLVKTLR